MENENSRRKFLRNLAIMGGATTLLLDGNTHTVYLGNLKQGLYVAQVQNDASSVLKGKFVI